MKDVIGEATATREALHPSRNGLWIAIFLACIQDAIYALVFLSYMNHYLLDVLGSSGALPGYTLALFGLFKLGMHPVAGRLLDRVSPRLIYWGAVTLQVVGLLVMLTSASLPGFLGATCLVALGSGAAWPFLYHLVARTQPAELAHFTPWRAAFGVSLVLVITPLLFQGMPVVGGRSIVRDDDGHARIAISERIAAVALFGAIVLADFAAVSSIAAAYGPYTKRTLGLDLLQTILVLTPAGIAAVTGLWVASRRSRPERRMTELTIMAVIAAGGTLALSFISVPALAVLVAIPPAAALGAIGPIVAAVVIEYGSTRDRGLVIGTLMAIEGAGAVAGPAITAFVIGIATPGAGFAAIGVMFLCMAALTFRARRPARRTTAA
ncbi:MFS transporter [bacterium]|nr:MFS transporter [bacterium]